MLKAGDRNALELSGIAAREATSGSLVQQAAGSLVPARPNAGVALAPQGIVRAPPRKSSRLSWMSFFLIVVLPTIAASLYLVYEATPRFVAEYRVAVRTVDPMKTGNMPGILGLAGASQNGNDSHAVVQYLQSRNVIEDLGRDLAPTRIYGDNAIDWFSRLDPAAPIEKVVRYWRSMVDSFFETTTGTVIVKIRAFRPEDARDLAGKTLALAEDLVNRMSTKARRDTVDFAQKEVDRAESRLLALSGRFRELRDQEQILDPRKSAESTLALVAKLKDDIARTNTDLSIQRGYMNETSPAIAVNRARLEALKKELERVNADATANPNVSSRPLSTAISGFEQLENERTFATKAYQSALASLETARMDASRQQIYLATIVKPELPEDVSFPKAWRDIPIVAGVLLAVWIICMLGVSSVREHM